MSTEQIQPLKIAKMSPSKVSRALAEISPLERRRNSPSWSQTTKQMVVTSSPFSENESPSLIRHRTSIENLKRVSRVKNSTMFAREQATEYNPDSPVLIQRPLRSHKRGESQTHLSFIPLPTQRSDTTALVPEDDNDKVSPARPLRRQGKSVTFDTAPPQINEYEMATPAPSSIASTSRESSYDNIYEDDDDSHLEDSFDASLEDTEKTPVVLPGDLDIQSPIEKRIGSDPDSRPLPPVPPFGSTENRRNSGNILDRIHNSPRSLPFLPQPATVSKSDILGMKDKNITMEDRLRLMGIGEDSSSKSNSRHATPEKSLNKFSLSPSPSGIKPTSLEDRLRKLDLQHDVVENTNSDQVSKEAARLQRHGLGIHVTETEPIKLPKSSTSSFTFPHISRESILRNIRQRSAETDGNEHFELGMANSPGPSDYDVSTLDPDVPIPSRELSQDDVFIKSENEEQDDLHSLVLGSSPPFEDGERLGSVVRHMVVDEESVYSIQEDELEVGIDGDNNDGPPTPRAESIPLQDHDDSKIGLPNFSPFMNDTSFHDNFQSFMSITSNEAFKVIVPETRSISPEEEKAIEKEIGFVAEESIHVEAEFEDKEQVKDYEEEKEEEEKEEELLEAEHNQGENEDEDEDEDEEEAEDLEFEREGTPDSVIHKPFTPEGSPEFVSPVIPVMDATIKSSGGKLKTRPSLSPADNETMAATRRQVSGTHPPPVPEKSPKRSSFYAQVETYAEPVDANTIDEVDNIERAVAAHKKRRESFKPKIEIGQSIGEDLSMDMDKEFTRLMEASKKGYLMRQNTKVVIAKRNFSNETNSVDGDRPTSADNKTNTSSSHPKPGHDRSKSWTTEPWNGNMRRRSLRSVDKKSNTATHQASLDIVPETQAQFDLSNLPELEQDQVEDGTERGRVFVKVVGVKDLDLQLPQNERTWFSLTLDNGLHCVTTSRLELGRSAPIGQEFELVVLSELEFQLTLQTHITPPTISGSQTSVGSKIPKSPVKKSAFSRFLASPKKKREQDRLAQVEKDKEEQLVREKMAQASAKSQKPASAWELLHKLVGEDGSFGRSYICLKSYEDSCFGRPITVDVPLYNEWALEDPHVTATSMKSKRSSNVLRRPPYQVGALTLQMLYVPRPKSAKDEDMPKSMNSCVREIVAAEAASNAKFEGHLSQHGGDCPYWRRRFFRLDGSMLRAFHETTRQPRANINLSKASKLLDEKRKNGRRRQSAFADEDQAYMFVEEGFRIRFNNGETIDFYADSPLEKDAWMKALSAAVGKTIQPTNSWCDIVLSRERALKERAERLDKVRPRSQGGADGAVGPAFSRLNSRRNQIKSMIF